jgi:hypothetical protein
MQRRFERELALAHFLTISALVASSKSESLVGVLQLYSAKDPSQTT